MQAVIMQTLHRSRLTSPRALSSLPMASMPLLIQPAQAMYHLTVTPGSLQVCDQNGSQQIRPAKGTRHESTTVQDSWRIATACLRAQAAAAARLSNGRWYRQAAAVTAWPWVAWWFLWTW